MIIINNGGSAPSDRYTGSWTACISGNNYCNTGDSGASYKDNSTNLIWSKTMNSSTYALDDSAGTMTWYKANNCTENSGGVCTKKASSKTGCDANSGWSLPHQKQLMQAYTNGSYGNIEVLGTLNYYWSITTASDTANYAWSALLSYGIVTTNHKTTNIYVRCVR